MKPWLKILVGLVLGIITGLILFHQVEMQSALGKTFTEFLTLVGKAFIDLLKMLVGLIVFSSLVVGMCHISDPKKMGRIGLTTIILCCDDLDCDNNWFGHCLCGSPRSGAQYASSRRTWQWDGTSMGFATL